MKRLPVWAQLVRLPNVFTAFADICLGWLAVLATAAPPVPASRWLTFALLLAASGCLYCGGMVFNDFFDVQQDKRERPFRPIPSGRVSPRAAALFGAALLATGLIFALLAGWSKALGGAASALPVLLAGLLTAAILLYDGWLKRTPLGPVGMGACRFLNVLLGLSAGDGLAWWGVHLAAVVGVYIAGVTWFARTEARPSNQTALTAAAGVMAAALFGALLLPTHFERGSSPFFFPYLLVALGFLVGFPVARAIAAPVPARVQPAVKGALMGLVVLDAILATGLVGAYGLIILALLAPALYLGRWIYST